MNENEEIHKKEDINYLEYNNRHFSKNTRFSSKEKICLYLGTTSYVCSKECRWDGKKKLYLASFKFNEEGKKLKIFNMVISQALINGMNSGVLNLEDKKLSDDMLRVFPLAIATMFTIQTPDNEREKYDGNVKYEYLLSQIIMNVLQSVGIDGVAYLSRQGKDDYDYPQMVCLAIPVNDISEQNKYGDLINKYTMISPVLFNEFLDDCRCDKESYINEIYPKYNKDGKVNCNSLVYYNGETVCYQDIPYSGFDNCLISQLHDKIRVDKTITI